MLYYSFKNSQKEPAFIADNTMRSKEDVLIGIESFEKYVLQHIENDEFHSIKFYKTVERELEAFKNGMRNTPLPSLTDDWWYYYIQMDGKGIDLCMNHIRDLSFYVDDEYFDSGVGFAHPIEEFKLFHDGFIPWKGYCVFRKLSVDEFAEQYGVEPVTVRQWIRRGKIRAAEKIGKQWLISELNDIVPGRARRAKYGASDIKTNDIPDEYKFLINSRDITITPIENNMYNISVDVGDSSKPVEMLMNDAERTKFEVFMISSTDYWYKSDVYFTFSSKDFSSIEELVQYLLCTGKMESLGPGTKVDKFPGLRELDTSSILKNINNKRRARGEDTFD